LVLSPVLRKIGGGVIGKGCVQEEIRFITCPELIVARLFVEQLADNEALVVQGVEQFANYEGYQDSFKCTGSFYDVQASVEKRILVAIDALDLPQILKDQKSACKYRHSLSNVLKQVLMVMIVVLCNLLAEIFCTQYGYTKGKMENFMTRALDLGLYQYCPAAINRELMKAYAGFSCHGIGIPDELPIASGNWGGGCFKVKLSVL
jgi:hypothetical protein